MDENEKRKEYLFITFVSVSNQADIRGSAEDIVSAPKGPLRKRSSRSQLLRYPGNGKAPPFREATTGNASALRRLPFRGDCFSFAVFEKCFRGTRAKLCLKK